MNHEYTLSKLRSLCAAKNLTEEAVAEHLKIDQSAYSKLERGKTKITIDHLTKLADLYKIASRDFLPDDSTPPEK